MRAWRIEPTFREREAWLKAAANDCMNARLVKVAPDTTCTLALWAWMASCASAGVAWLLICWERASVGYERNRTSVTFPFWMTTCTCTSPQRIWTLLPL